MAPAFAGATNVGKTCAALLSPYVGGMVSPPPSVPANFSQLSLAEAATLLAERKLPPVETWHPSRDGDSEMVICADGRWLHQGDPIRRPAMVRLFSTILRREPDGQHVLVTPGERLVIAVEDTAFRAVEMKSEGTGAARKLLFRLDTDDLVVAGPDHPLSFGSNPDDPQPLLHVRGTIGAGLQARIGRALFYQMVEIALADGAVPPAIWSDGQCFALVDP